MEEQKYFGLGIASFILSIISVICIFILLTLASAIEASMPGVMDFAIVAMIGFSVAGVGLGIAGVFSKDKKKIFAILGLIFSIAVFFVSVTAIVIGLFMSDSSYCNY
ncbi:MAG: hypothetical protein LBJ88_02890 [Campylobacteraceae bacterium]|jgi:hypothetical protein|nr:hypothetical protein [Campylobacteraceae bacterium]